MTSPVRLSRLLLAGLTFLLFFQLVSEFIETIYAFGLMGVTIPPEMVSIVLFISPALLLLFKRGLPRYSGPVIVIVSALLRLLEAGLTGSPKMLASGAGTGLLLVLLPTWLSQSDDQSPSAVELNAGAVVALASSFLLRTAGAGRDISLLNPGLSWILGGSCML
jgi:hypothetical protein